MDFNFGARCNKTYSPIRTNNKQFNNVAYG